ncbi:MAG: hypothetical protein OEV21_00795 [Thermoplasmata archaeon]|nr:hypothetical protein [Thermoplasmata archaeon]
MKRQIETYIQMTESINERYSPVSKDENEMILDAIRMFNAELLETKDVMQVLQNAAEVIYSVFGLKEILIGLKGGDGLFRYKVVIGHTKKAEAAIRNAAYQVEEMSMSDEFPAITICNTSEFSLKEDLPDNVMEIRQFNRPAELSKPRTSTDAMMEGDYLDVYIFGKKDEMLGWIEVSSPSDGKLPSKETIKGLELLASILGIVLSYIGLPE